jgi:hypothetical protein
MRLSLGGKLRGAGRIPEVGTGCSHLFAASSGMTVGGCANSRRNVSLSAVVKRRRVLGGCAGTGARGLSPNSIGPPRSGFSAVGIFIVLSKSKDMGGRGPVGRGVCQACVRYFNQMLTVGRFPEGRFQMYKTASCR